jgi:hypothetical protein
VPPSRSRRKRLATIRQAYEAFAMKDMVPPFGLGLGNPVWDPRPYYCGLCTAILGSRASIAPHVRRHLGFALDERRADVVLSLVALQILPHAIAEALTGRRQTVWEFNR